MVPLYLNTFVSVNALNPYLHVFEEKNIHLPPTRCIPASIPTGWPGFRIDWCFVTSALSPSKLKSASLSPNWRSSKIASLIPLNPTGLKTWLSNILSTALPYSTDHFRFCKWSQYRGILEKHTRLHAYICKCMTWVRFRLIVWQRLRLNKRNRPKSHQIHVRIIISPKTPRLN